MGRNEMLKKRNVILKINKKQLKKNLVLEKHYQNNTVRYKRPLLKIEQTFEKLEKAKHVDQLQTLIHQKIKINRKFLESYYSFLFEITQPAKIDPLASNILNQDFFCEYEYTDGNTNVWYVPEESAFCFNLDEHVETVKKQKLEATTRNLGEQFKESYEKYATVSLEEQIESDLRRSELKIRKINSVQIENIKAASSLPDLPYMKRRNLLNLIECNQTALVGATRDENDAYTEVPLLLLEHLLPSPSQPIRERNESSFADDILESNFECRYSENIPNPVRIVCSTPHFVTAQVAAKKMRKALHDTERALVELDVGFAKKKHPDTFPPLLFCTNHQLIHYLLDDLALSEVTHIILDRAQHRDDMFDLVLIYMRQFLLPKRPDLKLIILSSPIFMDILSKHFQIPYIKLSSTIKPNPVCYLEHILQETNFSQSHEHGNMKIIENVFIKDYHEKLEKHVNLLRLKGTYRAEVSNNILNPELEGVHIGLLTSLLTRLATSETSRVILVFLPNDQAIALLYNALVTSTEFSSDSHPETVKYHSKIMRKEHLNKKYLRDPKPLIILATDFIEVLDSLENVSHIVDCGCYEKVDFLAHFNIGTSELDWSTRQIHIDRKSWCEKRSTCKFYSLITSVRGAHLRGLCSSYLGRIRPDYIIYVISRLGIRNVAAFLERLDIKPQHRTIHLSLKRLETLNMLDSQERLTPLGFSLSSLPLPPHLARMAILGCVFSCVDPVLSVVAVLLYHNPFDETSSEPISTLKAKQSDGSLSDHMVWVRVLAWYENLLNSERNKASIISQCQSRGLLYDSLVLLLKVRRHLLNQLERAGYVRSGIDQDVNASCESLVEAIVYAGLYPNVAVIRSRTKIVLSKLMQVTIHPSSVYRSKSSSPRSNSAQPKSEPPDSAPNDSQPTKTAQSNSSQQCNSHDNSGRSFIAYSQCYGTDMGLPSEQFYIRDITPVSSMAVVLFSHDFHIPKSKPFKFSLNEMAYHFLCQDVYAVAFLERLRRSMNQIIENTIVNHTSINWTASSNQVKILRCALELIEGKNKECSITTVERQDIKALNRKNVAYKF